jgi:glycosyltransferase involved in cell wall biosynthesis
VLAGAERYSLNLALALAKLGCHVRVLTTQSSNYNTWQNTLRATEVVSAVDNGNSQQRPEVEILRFPNHSFRKPLLLRVAKFLWVLERQIPDFRKPKVISKLLDTFFLWAQGPWCPGLLNYLQQKSNQYDLVIFKSYLYSPCAYGIKLSSKMTKTLLIPAAHPEPAFFRPFVETMITNATGLGFVSKAEWNLVEKTWNALNNKDKLLLSPGLGNEWANSSTDEDPDSVRTEIRLLKNYFLVLGRVDKGKNLDFILRNVENGIKVVFAGPGQMDSKYNENFVFLGKVSEAEKAFLLQNSLALLAVSKNEAFSITTAEAIAHGCPVIGWSQSQAVSELIDNFGGIKFNNPEEFNKILQRIAHDPSFRSAYIPSSEKIRLSLSWETTAQKILQWLNVSDN